MLFVSTRFRPLDLHLPVSEIGHRRGVEETMQETGLPCPDNEFAVAKVMVTKIEISQCSVF